MRRLALAMRGLTADEIGHVVSKVFAARTSSSWAATACSAPPRPRSSTPTTSPRGCAPHYPVLYRGPGGLVAHECILDLRPITQAHRRHRRRRRQAAHRLRLPRAHGVVPGRGHADGRAHRVRGPRRARPLLRRDDRHPRRDPRGRAQGSGRWTRARCGTRRTPPPTSSSTSGRAPYSREQAAFPGAASILGPDKYWPPVSRIDGAYGDRNLVCSCPPLSAYEDDEED